MTPTIEDAAGLLCKGGVVPDWVITRLRDRRSLIGHLIKGAEDRSIERLLFESALHLRELLQFYSRSYAMIGEEYPPCIDDIDGPLHELISFVAEDALPAKAGRPRDISRHLCAAVCLGIWRDLHGTPQPHSPKLWEACEAYWVACGHSENPSGHTKNWEDFLTTP